MGVLPARADSMWMLGIESSPLEEQSSFNHPFLTTQASPVLAALFKNKKVFRPQLPLLKVESALSEWR